MASVVDAIYQSSVQHGVDPLAVLSVARQEGLSGAIGDSGTSFGPFQLHVGGAFPSTINGQSTSSWSAAEKQTWATSQAGIDYAVGKIASVSAPGAKGIPEIVSIVSRFERPANIPNEIAGATRTYTSLQNAARTHPTGDTSWLSGALGTSASSPQLPRNPDGSIQLSPPLVSNPLKTAEAFFAFVTSWRFAEVIGGALLLLVGVALLGKQFGLSVPLPPGAAQAAAAAPDPGATISHAQGSQARSTSRSSGAFSERVGGAPKRVRSSSGAGPGELPAGY
jgi:hypothetical protein